MSVRAARTTSRRWLARALLLAALLVAIVASLSVVPVPVPDTHSSRGATTMSEVNDWASAGHTFRTDRDGLYRIEVALSTLKRTDAANIQFYVREEPKGPNLREVKVGLAGLPEGRAMDLYNTRWQDLPWVSFEFEPLYGYAGKELYFNIEGKGVPRENSVQVLFSYPDSYSRGQAYRSEQSDEANMVFRTYTRGTLPELAGITFPLFAAGRPGPLGAELLYEVMAVAALAVAALLFASVVGLRGYDAHQ